MSSPKKCGLKLTDGVCGGGAVRESGDILIINKWQSDELDIQKMNISPGNKIPKASIKPYFSASNKTLTLECISDSVYIPEG